MNERVSMAGVGELNRCGTTGLRFAGLRVAGLRVAGLRVVASAALLVSCAGVALAQATDGASKPAPAKPAAAAKAATAAGAPQTGAGDNGLKSRVEQLEEQLVDMQVVVGTLESLAKSGGGSSNAFKASPPTSGGSADAARVESLEQQVRALTSQVQQLQDQARSGAPMRRSDVAPPPAAASSSFGSTTVTSGSGDAIGGLIASDAPAPSGAASGGGLGVTPSPVATAALGPAGEPSDPKQLYESAYGHLLQRNYGAAEVAFDEFLKRFPNDNLSGNAQYWLGETHFVRGQYKAAAGAFLKGYQTYAAGQKAPDSLLKLAMSLDRLGQKDAACSSFSELNAKFPNAPQSVKARAQSERQRVGCP